MSQTGVAGRRPPLWALLAGFPPAYWHGRWDTESSHSLRVVLLFELTPVSNLQSFCALYLPSIWDRSPRVGHPPFRNTREAGSALQLGIWTLLNPCLVLELLGLPGSLPERVSSRKRWEGTRSLQALDAGGVNQLPRGMHSLKCTCSLNICNKMFKLCLNETLPDFP